MCSLLLQRERGWGLCAAPDWRGAARGGVDDETLNPRGKRSEPWSKRSSRTEASSRKVAAAAACRTYSWRAACLRPIRGLVTNP